MGKSTFLQDFKAFAMKGNVVDMAVGVIIGGAFGKIVSSVVADIIMPPLGLLIGGVNFTDLKWVMKAAEYGADGKETAAVAELEGLVQVVGDEDDGLAHLLLQVDEFVLHVAADEGVKGAEGLVHEQDVRRQRQGAGQAHALLHAA